MYLSVVAEDRPETRELRDTGPLSSSTTENLAYGSPSNCGSIGINVVFSASAWRSQRPLDMHGSAGTVRGPGQDHGQFITLKIGRAISQPSWRKNSFDT